jgi:hypothetical protein
MNRRAARTDAGRGGRVGVRRRREEVEFVVQSVLDHEVVVLE